MIDTTAVIETRLGEYLAALNAIAPEGYSFDTEQGRKYTKICMTARGGGRSVHAFVGSDGAVYKPAGWARPAPHVRYSLADDRIFARLMQVLEDKSQWSGGYLYMR